MAENAAIALEQLREVFAHSSNPCIIAENAAIALEQLHEVFAQNSNPEKRIRNGSRILWPRIP